MQVQKLTDKLRVPYKEGICCPDLAAVVGNVIEKSK